jgi:pimeloyl-ACP methyl ester carboxylesterase
MTRCSFIQFASKPAATIVGAMAMLLSLNASAADSSRASNRTDKAEFISTRYRSIDVDGIKIFYREAGDPQRPAILLLHGFSSSSHMFRDLMPLLADKFHLIAPDYPGFGYSDAPSAEMFEPSFTNLETVVSKFISALGMKSFIVYMQDFGGPVGFRMAVKHPEWIKGLIIQNANAYLEGLPPQQPTTPNQKTSAQVVTPEFIHYMYRTGARDVANLNPDAWTIDIAVLQKPEAKRIQSALIDDYQTNINLYPEWQAYLKKWQPKTLIAWGKNDRGFLPVAAEAYRQDLHNVEIDYFDTGHFALEEDAIGIAAAIKRAFVAR